MFETETIREGDTGKYVTLCQKLLKGMSYTQSNGKPLSLTGKFGTQTTYATKKYQKDQGLTVDGIVGAKTWAKAINI